MLHLLTRNEAKLLQTVDRYCGSFLYELASAAQLMPADVFEAAERLDSRGYLALDRDKRFVTITGKGAAVNDDISRSSYPDPHLSVRGPCAITADAAARSSFEEMPEQRISEAIDAELEKYK